MIISLKKFFHPRQSKDPTLRQQNLIGYKIGRMGAVLIFIVGTILSITLSKWIVNLLQTLVWCIFDFLPFGRMANTFLLKVLSWNAVFHNEFMLTKIPFSFFMMHGKTIASSMWWLGFAVGMFFTIKYTAKVWVRYRHMNHHEQGEDHFDSPYNIEEETNKIPDRGYRYDIPSGIFMMHKLNWRGMVNKVVKQRLFSLIMHFQLDKDHDPTQKQFSHFYAMFKFLSIVILSLLGILSIHGFYSYNFGGSSSHISGMSPFWLFLVIWWIIHFIVKGFLDLFVDLGALQIDLFSQSFSEIALVLLIECLVFGVFLYHFGRIIGNELRYGDVRAYISKWHSKLKSHKKRPMTTASSVVTSIQSNFHNSRIMTMIDEIKNPTNNIDGLKDILNKEHCHYDKQHPVSDTKYWRKKAIHSYIYPFIHGKHPFFKQPIDAIEMAGLEFLSNVLPLDKGTTGSYYVTNGNGTMQNVLLYGITRSGKGQMIINTIIDTNSRAAPRYQKNMIFNDSKGELASMTSQILKKRGYNVRVLNIMDPTHSMSYNPLADVIKQTQVGDIGAAAKSCASLAGTIYKVKPSDPNKFFYDEAGSLFDAIVFALLAYAHSRYFGLDNMRTIKYKGSTYNIHDDGLASDYSEFEDVNGTKRNPQVFIYKKHKYYVDNDKGKTIIHSTINSWSRVTIHNTLALMTQLGGENAQTQGGGADGTNRMVVYFEHLTHHINSLQDNGINSEIALDQFNIMNQATSEFEQSKISGGGRTAGSIYTTFINNLKIYQQPDIAKMTSLNSYHAEEMGFDRLLTVQFSRAFGQQQIKVYLRPGVKKTFKDSKTGKTYQKYVPDYDKHKIVESVNSKLTSKGVAQVPFENPVHYQHFFVEFQIFDERVNNQQFDFLFRCDKQYYTVPIYEDIYHNPEKRPSVADLELVVGRAHHRKLIVTKNKKYGIQHTMQDKHGKTKLVWTPLDKTKYSLNDIQVIDKYTKKRSLKDVPVKLITCPSDEEYAKATPTPTQSGSPVYKLQDHNPRNAVRQTHFLYNPHPTALFLVTPPNQPDLNQLCTFLINQTFNTLSALGLHITKGRHIQRPLQFILDELGNIPAIPDMPKKLSIGLSQHIEFMLVFQNTEQILTNYGQTAAKSITSNCSTTYYILSKSEATIDAISKACGKRTITASGRNVDPTKPIGTSNNGSNQAQPVITPTELRHLKPGEIVILRTNDRSSVSGQSRVPWPIFDTGRYVLPYSFWFLKGYESSESLNEVPVVTPHKYLKMNKVTTNFTGIYNWMEAKDPIDTAFGSKVATAMESQIKNSGLSKQFQIIFHNEMVDMEQQQNSQGLLKLVNRIRKELPFYQSLQLGNDLAQLSVYTVSAICQKAKNKDSNKLAEIQGLDSKDKHNCQYILNFIADEQFTATNYCKAVKKKIKKNIPKAELPEFKATIPFLYGNTLNQILGYCKSDIESTDEHVLNTQIESPSQYELANESWLLNEINYLFTDFLHKMGLIDIDDDRKYDLTEEGQFLTNDKTCKQALKVFLANNKFAYQPDTSWFDLLFNGLKNIIWVHQHPKYSAYYGLAFALGTCSISNFNHFNEYTGVGKDKQTHTFSLGAFPIVYISALFPIYDAFIRHPDKSLTADQIKPSKPTLEIMTNMKKLDAIMHNFYVRLSQNKDND